MYLLRLNIGTISNEIMYFPYFAPSFYIFSILFRSELFDHAMNYLGLAQKEHEGLVHGVKEKTTYSIQAFDTCLLHLRSTFDIESTITHGMEKDQQLTLGFMLGSLIGFIR